eukprot:391279_1
MNQFASILLVAIAILWDGSQSQQINMTTGFLTCDAENDCSNQEIVCSARSSCHIDCVDPNSCENTIMRRGDDSFHLYVTCNSSACINAVISDTRYIDSYGSDSLNGATING